MHEHESILSISINIYICTYYLYLPISICFSKVQDQCTATWCFVLTTRLHWAWMQSPKYPKLILCQKRKDVCFDFQKWKVRSPHNAQPRWWHLVATEQSSDSRPGPMSPKPGKNTWHQFANSIRFNLVFSYLFEALVILRGWKLGVPAWATVSSVSSRKGLQHIGWHFQQKKSHAFWNLLPPLLKLHRMTNCRPFVTCQIQKESWDWKYRIVLAIAFFVQWTNWNSGLHWCSHHSEDGHVDHHIQGPEIWYQRNNPKDIKQLSLLSGLNQNIWVCDNVRSVTAMKSSYHREDLDQRLSFRINTVS